jgi:hypothetical protein
MPVMNLAELHRKLIAAARAHPPGDRVPYAFEKRVMAHLKARPPLDFAALWARALWRAAAPCVAVALLLGTWSMAIPNGNASPGDLSQQFENTLFAGVDQEVQEADMSW